MPLLEVADLTGGYGATDILHAVSFSVEAGGITTILGANGAGKTSVLRALCGMLRVSDGKMSFAGEKINGRATESIVRLGIGHVPAGRGTFLNLTTFARSQKKPTDIKPVCFPI